MYREIPHTADVAYEFECENLEQLLEDVIKVLMENVDPLEFTKNVDSHADTAFEHRRGYSFNTGESKRNERTECFEWELHKVDEDTLFDVVNQIISIVDKGWYPEKVSGNCVTFFERPLILRVKALTYHGLKLAKVGDKLFARMVFDR